MIRGALRTAAVLMVFALLPWRGLGAFAQADPPGTADIAGTIESPLTPEIRQLAEELQNDPVRIVRWVQASLVVEPTFGILKGAAAALDDRSANPADQAALVIAILRSARVPARFVVGRITVTREAATKWLGYPGALDILQRAQTPLFRDGDTVFPNAQFAGTTLRHVWVEFFVQNHGWIAADPSHKETVILSRGAFRLSEQTNARVKALIDSAKVDSRTSGVTGIDETAISRLIDELAQDFGRRPREDIAGLFRAPDLTVPQYQSLDDLKHAFPHRPQSIELRAASLPDYLHLQVRISWAGMEFSAAGAALVDRRISLFWVPTNSTDASAIQNQGLLAALGSGIRLIPVIAVDGELKGVGQTAQLAGATLPLRVSLEYPGGGGGVEPTNGPPSGGFASLLLGWGQGSPGSFRRLRATVRRIEGMALNSTVPMEEILGSLFHLQGSVFWFLQDFMLRIAERATGATLLRRPSVLLSGMYVISGQPQALIASFYVGGLAGTTIAVAGDDRNSAATLRWIHGIMGTATEGRLFQMLYNRLGYSTVELFREAVRQQIPIVYARPDNVRTVLSSTDVSLGWREFVINRASSPLAVHAVMPTRSIRVGGGNLWGFYEFNPQTGGSGGWIEFYAKGGILLGGNPLFEAANFVLRGLRYLREQGTFGVPTPTIMLTGRLMPFVNAIGRTIDLYADLFTIWHSTSLSIDERMYRSSVALLAAVLVVGLGFLFAAGVAAAVGTAPILGIPAAAAVALAALVSLPAWDVVYSWVRQEYLAPAR